MYQSPYINHPIGVAYLLWREGGVTDLPTLQVRDGEGGTGGQCVASPVQAALLHDTIEDTATCEGEIEELFGEEVRGIVMEVTDDKSLAKWERKKYQVRCQLLAASVAIQAGSVVSYLLPQIEHAPHKSYKAKLVSLGDKLYNLRDLDSCPPASWDQQRVSLYFQWAAQVGASPSQTAPPLLCHACLLSSCGAGGEWTEGDQCCSGGCS